MKESMKLKIALGILLAIHGAAVLAGFLAPYGPTEQNRDFPYAPPVRIRFIDAQGNFHFRPFVYPLVAKAGGINEYVVKDQNPAPLTFFVREEIRFPAVEGNGSFRFFGVEPPATVFLLGTDSLGRDQFSRLLYGARVSLLAGLLAASLTLALGLVLGILSGYFGGWVDAVLMRGAELFLALPWLYLLFAVRAMLPLHMEPQTTFLLLVVVIGAVGWARPARLFRGVALSARERGYVLAAKNFGASTPHILWRHIFPQTRGLLLAQASLLIPQYIMAEVTLSFVGLGVNEPAASWGGMLANLQQFYVLVSYWWLLAPGFLLILVFLCYLTVAGYLEKKVGSFGLG